MSHAELLKIAKKIQEHHPTVKRQSPFDRLQTESVEYDIRGHVFKVTKPKDRDQGVRNAVAEHLWERKGQKGPAVLKRERAEAEREASEQLNGLPKRRMVSLL